MIEMLVVIAIIGLLAALMLPSMAAARRKGQRAHCANTLKQVGTAIQTYADEHEDYLPGPIDVGVPINYTASSKQVLTWHIARYLDLPPPSTVTRNSELAWPMVCPGYRVDRTYRNTSVLLERCYTMNWSTNTTPDAWFPWKPFGYPTLSTEAHRLTEIATMSPSTERWAMQDVDKTVADCPNWNWYVNLPDKPTHRPRWNRLHFDWHVSSVDKPDIARTGFTYAP